MDASPYCRPPELSAGQISRLSKRFLPLIEVVEDSVKQLPGYEDRNFYLEAFITETKSEETNSTASRRFVLKVFNSVTPQELAEGITSVLMHLKSRGIHCPVPIVSREGNTVLVLPEEEILQQDAAVIRSRRKPKFCTVLLTYISGMTLEKFAEPSPQLLYEVGKYVGEIDAALQDFSHPVLDSREFSEPSWDLRRLHHLEKYLPSIKDPKNREVAEKVMRNHKKYAPKYSFLKTGIIWGDAHQQNIILEEQKITDGGKQSTLYKVAGVIDFGDCNNTCYLFELGILLAELMQGRRDPVRFACPLISGYLHAFPLGEEEMDCLYHVVLARLCQAATVTEHQHSQEPWNNYLGEMIKSGWELVHVIQNIPKEDVDRIWSEACK